MRIVQPSILQQICHPSNLCLGGHHALSLFSPCTSLIVPRMPAILYLKAKLHTLQDFVHASLAKAAKQQKQQYDRFTTPRFFKAGDPVWLSIPTAGKLQPRWDGG